MKMSTKHTTRITVCAVMTALTFVLTAYLQIPSTTGYVHVGDSVIYLSACLLPLPYAVFVGAVGGTVADLLSGFAIWAPGTLVIKSVSVLFFSRAKKFVCTRNLIALVAAALISTVGYYLYESMLLGSLLTPLLGIPGYIMQAVLSGAIFIALGLSFDKMKLKSKLGVL